MTQLKKLSLLLLLAGFSANSIFAQHDSVVIRKIFDDALSNGKSYSNLNYLCKKIGGRLSGSPQAQQAVEWAFKAMKDAGADTVYLQECMVPHWVRGEKEVAKVFNSNSTDGKTVSICALGGSIATPTEGITASVIEIQSFEELAKLGKEKIKGKIVFFNHCMNPLPVNTFNAYGDAVMFRWAGASEAARYGALATVVSSCTQIADDFPHTGVMHYEDSITKIPTCAISSNGANWLSYNLKTTKELKFFLKMSCQTLPDEKSYNVIGEMKGNEHPNEFIVVGGHLDSWDNGEGANDDGCGVVQSMEVIRIFKSLGIRPKCTIRVIAFMNEENGSRGGKKYAEIVKLKNEKHIAAIESDAGSFTPLGFNSDVTVTQKIKLKSWRPLFEPYGIYNFDGDGSGVDIAALKEMGIACLELSPDSQRYFDYHHAASDVFENVNKRELELGGAAMTALIWMISQYGL